MVATIGSCVDKLHLPTDENGMLGLFFPSVMLGTVLLAVQLDQCPGIILTGFGSVVLALLDTKGDFICKHVNSLLPQLCSPWRGGRWHKVTYHQVVAQPMGRLRPIRLCKSVRLTQNPEPSTGKERRLLIRKAGLREALPKKSFGSKGGRLLQRVMPTWPDRRLTGRLEQDYR